MTKKRTDLPKKGSRISRQEAEQFLELYYQLGTYTAVAERTGRSASSVGKWVKILQAESINSHTQINAVPIIMFQQTH